MKILFISISTAVSNLENRGIYPDLLRKFANEGHEIFIIAPAERRTKTKTNIKKNGNVVTLLVKTLNITKTNFIEKGISTLLIEHQFSTSISKHFNEINFDLILYTTPPITFNGLIKKLKLKNKAATYLLLKDIFPQNAIDLELLSKLNPLYWFFKKKEKALYAVSDFIGCMSPANIEYLTKHNPEIPVEKLEVCPNSISPTDFDGMMQLNKQAIRKKYHIPIDKTVFIYGGNLGKPQGIEFLIDVLKSNKNRNDVYFVIAGSGTNLHLIESYIEGENPGNMQLHPQMPRNEFDELLNACDVGLIFLDKRYSIPNYPSRLLNYLEFKKPVLIATDRNTDVGSIAEENEYGLWVESGDLNTFNKKIDYLILNKEVLISMGEKGYNFLIENYTVDTTYKTIMSHFK